MYGIKATAKEEPKKKNESAKDYATLNNFFGYVGTFNYSMPKSDITNGNLTPRISDILNAVKNGTINFDYNKENE